MSDVIIRPIDIERDAEGLAAMWNASDLQWPGSWNNGLPTTAAMVREWLEEQRNLVVYLAEVDGEIAGYCSFEKGEGQAFDDGYLGLLNVSPKFQKRSIGRKLIQATIDRSVKEGWKRQTLGTWTANFKAVPTYKKTGHFWTPDSAVWMQNFIPGALQMPLAAPFFAKHNWYDSYVRELEQCEDDQRWEGLKVFTQHWEAEGEALTIWIDREARAPVAIETDAVQVAAIAADIKPLAGELTTLRWRVKNKGAQALSVWLHAQGDKGLSIDHRDAFVVPAGETMERSAEVKVEADASSEKDDGTAPAVRSLVRVGDTEVELFSGLRVRKPLRIDTAPGQVSLTPGVPSSLALQLHNERPEPTTLTLTLTPPEGLRLSWAHKQVTVPAQAHLSLPLSVTAAEERAYDLAVRGEYSEAERKPLEETLTLFAVDAGGVLVRQSGSSARLETEVTRILVEAKAGSIKLEDKASGITLGSLRPEMGPPYWPTDFRAAEFALRSSERAGRAVLSMAAESEHAAGVSMHLDLALSATGLLTVRCWTENRSARPVTRRVRLGLRQENERTLAYLPLRMGCVRAPGGDYPTVPEDAPRDPAAYQEPWRAWEREGNVVAVGWDGSVDQVDGQWMTTFRSRELLMGPGESTQAFCVAIYSGPGNWCAARRALMAWRGLPSENTPVLRPLAQARLEPAVLGTTSREVCAKLRVDTASTRPTDGQVDVHAAAGMSARPARLAVSNLTREAPVVQPLTLSLSEDRLGVYRGEVRLGLTLDEVRTPFTLLRLGVGDAVRVSQSSLAERAVWTIDNSAAELVVAPDFGPSLIAWNVGGVNQLWSTFPTPQGFSWRYPTFGGLHPLLFPIGSEVWTGFLHREQVSARPVECETHGLRWQGLRLAVQPTHELLKGVAVEVDLLTLGGSNVLKTVVRVRNLWDAEQRITAGHELYCALGGPPSDLLQHSEGRIRRPSTNSAWQTGLVWGALANVHTGRTMLLASAAEDIGSEDTGQSGRMLRALRELRLAANQVCEVVSYAVLADSLEIAKGYLALRGL